ncbi:hypothetical protein [Asticcacaulis solisilvae]|uniref:hypothetical protein n=1 Tax=Asticcacaulis solisilvae TaxID=1217274 RepID=UPI003FD881D3
MNLFRKLFKSKIEHLIEMTVALSTRTVIMPVEILRLASSLSDLKDRENTIAVTARVLPGHESLHVRRVFFLMIKFMGKTAYDADAMAALLLRGLNDAEPWVQYDAAWGIEVLAMNRPEFIAALEHLAEGYSGDEAASGSAEDNLQWRASRALKSIRPEHG